jgi:hypothetical protein
MLESEPRLLRATWDWGGGDFETALGGAAHMGRRDIAAWLLERGIGCPAVVGPGSWTASYSAPRACQGRRPVSVTRGGVH